MTKDGAACQGQRQLNSAYCYFHDPARAQDRKKHSGAGGRKSSVKEVPRTLSKFEILGMPKFKIRTVADIVKLLGFVMNAILQKKIDPKVGTSIAFICNCTLNALDRLQTVDIQVRPSGGLRPETIKRIENEINLI